MSDSLFELAREAATQTLQFCMETNWKHIKSLRGQIQRSSFSVPSNIAEGIGRAAGKYDLKARNNFYRIAFGSLRECKAQLEVLSQARIEFSERIKDIVFLWSRLEELLAIELGVSPVDGSSTASWTFISSEDQDRFYERPCFHFGDCIRNCSYWKKKGEPCQTLEKMVIDSDGIRWIYRCRNCFGDGDAELIFPKEVTAEMMGRMEKRKQALEERRKEWFESLMMALGVHEECQKQ